MWNYTARTTLISIHKKSHVAIISNRNTAIIMLGGRCSISLDEIFHRLCSVSIFHILCASVGFSAARRTKARS